jgi:hypothetical protein
MSVHLVIASMAWPYSLSQAASTVPETVLLKCEGGYWVLQNSQPESKSRDAPPQSSHLWLQCWLSDVSLPESDSLTASTQVTLSFASTASRRWAACSAQWLGPVGAEDSRLVCRWLCRWLVDGFREKPAVSGWIRTCWGSLGNPNETSPASIWRRRNRQGQAPPVRHHSVSNLGPSLSGCLSPHIVSRDSAAAIHPLSFVD